MKICSKCRVEQSLDCFHNSKNRKDKLSPSCKSCSKEYRETNKERLLQKKKEYYQANIEAMREKNRKRYSDDPVAFTEQQRNYYSTISGRKSKILAKTKERAMVRGMDFDLELEDIQIPTHCPFLGIELTHSLGKGQLKTNSSIDRIDNTKGYIKGNVQIISRLANTMKQDATPEQLVAFAKSILRIYGEKS